jgi:tartrate-resistant acid phosphatase type 5
MPDFFSEPFLHLAGLTHKSALIAWGAFYFRVKDSGKEFKLVDDDDLDKIHPPRRETIGARSEPYGNARVAVFDKDGQKEVASAFTNTANHCWVPGLEPDTEYTYKVFVNEEEWARGERRDWVSGGDGKGLNLIGRSYRNRFRTHPDPTRPSPAPFTFAVLGDFGVGIRKDKDDRRQRQIAEALEQAVKEHNVRLILTTGDNIYRSGGFLGTGGQTGDEDDDWYFTYYQPYRYVINRVPVYPSIGNHDAGETESRDDRTQLEDNFYINERIAGEEAAGRASVDPGLFYRFRFSSDVEFICIDTSKEPTTGFKDRLFKHPKHQEFLKLALPAADGGPTTWRIPFCHHPPFSAGPQHHNTGGMEELIEQFRRAGVRAVFSGHEHNFQHSRADGVDYFVTGGAGKIRTNKPKKFEKARTLSWAAAHHFLLVTVEGKRMTVRPIAELGEIGRAHV